ncbi:hypothetical protein MMC09_000513, partial [Bachmanniomyces sp. S44760]|nr:hypothetical protein [Bachmanniomyces sp. S44760]
AERLKFQEAEEKEAQRLKVQEQKAQRQDARRQDIQDQEDLALGGHVAKRQRISQTTFGDNLSHAEGSTS